MGRFTRYAVVVGSVALVATPAAVLTHCLAYEVAHRIEPVLGPLAGTPSAGHHDASATLAGSGAHAGHAGHLPLIPLTAGALAAGALALLAAAITVQRHTSLPRPRRSTLLAAQLAVIAAIEAATLADGRPLLTSAVLLAVLAQLPAALVARALTTRVRSLVARLTLRQRPRLPAVRGLAHAVRPEHGAAWWLAPEVALSRGPPTLLGI